MIKTITPFLKNEEYTMPDAKSDGTYDFSHMPTGLFGMAAAGVRALIRSIKLC